MDNRGIDITLAGTFSLIYSGPTEIRYELSRYVACIVNINPNTKYRLTDLSFNIGGYSQDVSHPNLNSYPVPGLIIGLSDSVKKSEYLQPFGGFPQSVLGTDDTDVSDQYFGKPINSSPAVGTLIRYTTPGGAIDLPTVIPLLNTTIKQVPLLSNYVSRVNGGARTRVESLVNNPKLGKVEFESYGNQYLVFQMGIFTDGLSFVTGNFFQQSFDISISANLERFV